MDQPTVPSRGAGPRGVIAAALTPLTDGLEPDIGLFLDHARWLLARGCDGIGMLGTTGEANSLSASQRAALIEAAAEALPPDRLLVGTGSPALAETVDLTRTALAAGCADMLVLPPYYYKPVSDDGLFAFFAALIERVGDARLRLYLYNIPQFTGIAFGLDLIGRLRDAFPGIVVGLKDSSGKWESMHAVCEAFPGFAVFAGTETHLLSVLRAGGAGCISATANATAPLCGALYRGWEDEDADARQERLTAVRLAMQQFPVIAAQKALARRRTGDARWANILPPNRPLGAVDEERLNAELAALGFAWARETAPA